LQEGSKNIATVGKALECLSLLPAALGSNATLEEVADHFSLQLTEALGLINFMSKMAEYGKHIVAAHERIRNQRRSRPLDRPLSELVNVCGNGEEPLKDLWLFHRDSWHLAM
jgi:hypothetical protein